MNYPIDKRESKRITCLRALCVILVLYLHQYAGDRGGNTRYIISGTVPGNIVLQDTQYIISRIITFSAVPLFFMLSSLLLYAKQFDWKNNLKKKLKTLFLPYIIWITIYILIYYIGQTIPLTRAFFANPNRKISQMGLFDFIGAYTGIGGNGLFVNALWFLRDLIILNLLAGVIKRLIDKYPRVIFVLLILLWNLGSVPGFFILDRQSIVFFALGYYIAKYNYRMSVIDKFSNIGIVLLYALTIAIEFFYYKTDSLLQISAHSFSTILGIIFLIKLSGIIIPENRESIPRIIEIIGKYSFFIYASQDLLQTIFKKMVVKLTPQTDMIQMIEYCMIPLCVCIFAAWTGYLTSRIIPEFFDLITGSRVAKKHNT